METSEKKKALIAMSGGVDSSVAAYLMKDSGYDCMGCTMKLYDSDDVTDAKTSHTCCSLDDIADARRVAANLGMNYSVYNFQDSFKEKVIDKFIYYYEHGMTPNPCIDCNRYLKFDALYKKAKELGCDYVVTGHYARIEKEGDKYLLKKAVDDTKDQSYVLYTMTQDQLAHTKYPLGELTKVKAREIANANGFLNADKPDSQDICFVPDGDYASVIRKYSGKDYPSGDFVDREGHVLGTHKGIIGYTLGQRKGLGISAKEPYYVCKICTENNTVVLGGKDDLFTKEVYVDDFNWISGEAPIEEIRIKAKTRYRQKEAPASLAVLEDGTVKLTFDEPQRAVTPGQAAVVYDGDIVLGGGTIIRSE